ncbi:TPA: hypothetical protein ACV8DK_005664, partial [Escherichia coli]
MNLNLKQLFQHNIIAEIRAFAFRDQNIIAMRLFFCGLSPLTKLPGDVASTKNSNHTTQQPTETTIGENGSTGCKNNRVNSGIYSPIEHMSNMLKPVTVPEAEHQVVAFSDFAFSWFFVHDRLVLTASTLTIFRGRGGLSSGVIFIGITHLFFSFVCKASARYVFDRTTGACRIARPSFPVEGEKNRINHKTTKEKHTQKNRLPAFAWSGYSFPA